MATNLPLSELGSVFPAPRLVAAMVDHVAFNAHILETGTQSYRLRTSKTANEKWAAITRTRSGRHRGWEAEAMLSDGPDWQLAWYDVPESVIQSAGATLDELLGFVPDGLDELPRWTRPRAGWRLIHGENPIPARGDLSVLAAPWPSAGKSRWALVDIANPEGEILMVTSQPEDLRPGRAMRRRGLRLEWPVTHIAHRRGDRLRPKLMVRNTLSHTWVGDGQDHELVSGTVFSLDGTTPPPPVPVLDRGFLGLRTKRLGRIPPGGSVELVLTRLNNTDMTALPPGEWLLTAQLQNLNLPAPPITVIVTA